MKQIICIGSNKEVQEILDRIIKENPGMTIEEYINKYDKEILILS